MKYVVGIITVLLLLAACQSTDQGATVMKGLNPAFQVGSKSVTVDDFQQRMKEDLQPAIERFLAQGKTREEITTMADEQKVRQLVFDRMIQEELLVNLAKEEGVTITPAEVDTELKRQQELQAAQGISVTLTADEEATKRAEIERQQLILTMIARHTTEDSFHSRHILLRVDVPVTATVEERDDAFAKRKTEVDALMKQLDEGADFAELATDHSEDPGSAANGGDLGWVSRGVFVPEFETVALSPTVALSQPVEVKSMFGWHIIEVLGRKSTTFTSVDELRNTSNPGTLVDATFTPWYDAYRKEAEASGLLKVDATFDPNKVPLPFPDNMPVTTAVPSSISQPPGVTVVVVSPTPQH